MHDSSLRQYIIWVLHLWVFLTPFVFTAINDELFEFNKMLFSYSIAIILAALWAIQMILAKKIQFQRTIFLIPIGFYLLSHVLSTLFSIHPFTSIFGYYSRFHGGLLSTITYITFFFVSINALEKKDIRPLIRTSILGMIGVALYAIPEHFGISPSCILITHQATTSCWVQDVQTRVFATFGQPNWLAAYLLVLLPLAWWLAMESWKKKINKLRFQNNKDRIDFAIAICALTLGTAALLYTRSRSGFLGLGISFAIISGGTLIQQTLSIFATLRKRLEAKNIQNESIKIKIIKYFSSMTASFLLSAIVLATVIVLGSPYTPSANTFLTQKFSNQKTSIQTAVSTENEAETPQYTNEDRNASIGTLLENGGTDSGQIRKIVWKGALLVWKRYPVFGSGLDTFAYSYYKDRPMEHNLVSEWDFLYNRAHNEFLNILATTGIVGFIATLTLMLSFVCILLLDIMRPSAKLMPHSSFQLALLSAYIGLAVSNFLGFSTVVVGALFFLLPSWWIIWKKDTNFLSLKSSKNKDQELKLPVNNKNHNKKQNTSSHYLEKTTSIFLTKKINSSEITTDHKLSKKQESFSFSQLSGNQQWGIGGIIIVATFLLLYVWGMWSNDHKFAKTKAYLDQGDAYNAYISIQELVAQAPYEANYTDQQALTLARLAVGTSLQDATAGAVFVAEAIKASDRTIELNPVHLNFWKNRARIFLLLGTLDPQYFEYAKQALLTAQDLAPTDVKINYNLALLYQAQQQTEKAQATFEQVITMKPNYEEARNAYAKLLEDLSEYSSALEQYEYILKYLNPTAPTASEGAARVRGIIQP